MIAATSTGPQPDRAMLTVYCADTAAHEEWLFRQLGTGSDGSAQITELPDDVDAQVLPSATADLIRDLLAVCAQVTEGSALDPRSFEPVLENAKAQLGARTGATFAPDFLPEALHALERDLLNNTFGWSGEPCAVQRSGRHQMLSPGMLQGETAEEQVDAMRQLFEMDLPSSVLIARLVEGEPEDGVVAIVALDDAGNRMGLRARVLPAADDGLTLSEIQQDEVEPDDFETAARELMKISAEVLSGRLARENEEWRRAAALVRRDT